MNEIVLPTPPSPEILVRLVRARQFLEHAKAHAAGATDLDYMIATHSADNAVEFVLKLIAEHLRYEEVSGATLPETELAQIAGVLSKFLLEHYKFTLPYLPELKVLRQVRNLVQHGSFTPGADIERQLTIADRFFAQTCKLVFGLDATQLRIASAVTDPVVKRHLLAAEEAIAERRFEDGVRSCRNAFEEATYKHRSRSPMAVPEVPARLELAKLAPAVERFLASLSEELDALRLKVDANRLERFREIARHLPSEQAVEPLCYTVLQRPWERRDAEFCYGFVSENVLRWQEQEFAPLYALNQSPKYRFVEMLEDIPLSECEPGGCIYGEDDHEIKLMHVTLELRDQLMNLQEGKVYRFASKRFKDGELDVELSYLTRVRFIGSELVTHDPARWRIVLDTSKEPLTWHCRHLANGKIVKETPSLQTCTVKDLTDLYPVDLDAANRIIAAREQHGVLTSAVLRQTKGVTKKQVTWIESFMRA